MEIQTENKLNEAAELLLSTLPDHAGQLVARLAEDAGRPIWQIISGVLLHVHSEARLSLFQTDPAWKDGLKQTLVRCKRPECNRAFKPDRIGQLYCSPKCGEIVENTKLLNKTQEANKDEKETQKSIVRSLLDAAMDKHNKSVDDSVDLMPNPASVNPGGGWSKTTSTVEQSAG